MDKIYNEEVVILKEHHFTSCLVDEVLIYQMKKDRLMERLGFLTLEQLKKMGIEVDRDNYNLVYSSTLDDLSCVDSDYTPESVSVLLEKIYTQFNVNHPANFKGHSLSIGDIVVLNLNKEVKAYYVNDTGFKEIPEFSSQIIKSADIYADKFFVRDDKIIWMRYNESTYDGLLIIRNEIKFENVLKASRIGDYKIFFKTLEATSLRLASEAHSLNPHKNALYEDLKYNFYHNQPFATGLSKDTMDKIIQKAMVLEAKQKKEAMLELARNNCCPNCSSENIEWDTFEMWTGDNGYFAFECSDCGTKGKQYYSLVFEELEIIDDEGKSYQYKN